CTAVPDGVYKPRVHHSGSHRTIVLPNPILVDTQLPRISLVRRNLTVVSPDGDKRHDYLKVFFRTSEPARAVLYARLRQVLKLKSFSADSLQWGLRNGMPSRPGQYHLYLRAIDRAGNLGPPSAVFPLRVRYLAPAGHRPLLAAGAVAGIVAALVGAWLLLRWPWLLALAALACVPARFTVKVGGTNANLLVPMYGVVAAAAVAVAWQLWRRDT